MDTTLFLHMGPGLNAYAEKTLLSAQWPSGCEYWDQPPTTGASAYTDLVALTVEKIQKLSLGGSRKVNLVAHSFGGHLARESIGKVPECVGSLRLISTGHDPVVGFHRLLKTLESSPGLSAELRAPLHSFLQENPVARTELLWKNIGLLLTVPDFMHLYWPSRTFYDAHLEATRVAPPLVFPTFQSVLNQFSRQTLSIPRRIAWKGDAELVLGGHDPLIDPPTEKRYWESVFPGIRVVNRNQSGHYPHLEHALRPYETDEFH